MTMAGLAQQLRDQVAATYGTDKARANYPAQAAEGALKIWETAVEKLDSHAPGQDEVAARSEGGDIVGIKRSDLDDAQRTKRAECASCRYTATCEGVWKNYLKRYGWDEFVPVG